MGFVYLLCAMAALFILATRLAPERMTQLALFAERRRSGLTARNAHVAGFDMPYLEGGSGEVLLLVHGFGGDKDNFTRIARFLTPHYRVLIPDLPGFGDASRDPEASYFMADQVARLHTFLTQLGIGQVHLGGHSMGGFIAAQFAATLPQAVASVWLLDAAGTQESYDTPMATHYRQTGETPLLLRSEEQFDTLVAAATHKAVLMPRFVRTALGRRAVADFALHSRIMQQMTKSPLLETQYRLLQTPAFIVWGAQDQLLNPEGATSLKELFPNSRVCVMEGIGHMPMVEAPQRAAHDYLEFRRALV
jgi:pimeloyl-ACP methyl ester carboxylesterase